jgi:hypothetical protein
MTEIVLTMLFAKLEHRFEVIEMANRYVDFLQIGRPLGLTCEEIDTEKAINDLKQLPNGEHMRFRRLENWFEGGPETHLFPFPVREVCGVEFKKGPNYVAYALYLSKLPVEELKVRVEALVKQVNKEMESAKDSIKHDRQVAIKRQ